METHTHVWSLCKTCSGETSPLRWEREARQPPPLHQGLPGGHPTPSPASPCSPDTQCTHPTPSRAPGRGWSRKQLRLSHVAPGTATWGWPSPGAGNRKHRGSRGGMLRSPGRRRRSRHGEAFAPPGNGGVRSALRAQKGLCSAHVPSPGRRPLLLLAEAGGSHRARRRLRVVGHQHTRPPRPRRPGPASARRVPGSVQLPARGTMAH